MTAEEAKVAVRLNSVLIYEKIGVSGYAYAIQWIHEKGAKPFITVGIHDLKANCVYWAKLEDLKVYEWNAEKYIVSLLIEEEAKR